MGGSPAVFALGAPADPTGPEVSRRQELALEEHSFAHDSVLGTSLELIVEAARPGDAVRCQVEVLAEIERLRAILSTYDPASEISRVSAGGTAVSTELRELLASYDFWSGRTGGAVDVRLGQVMRLWREAAQTGRAPEIEALRAALEAPGHLNVDALGKAYIIDRAVEIARRLVPAGLLNIGGDLRVWGDVDWVIGVADPRNPAENAPLLAEFALRDAAVATSGDYARPLSIGDQFFSHVIDPRTLQPAANVSSATVVARDCVTANALATAASVLSPTAGSALMALYRATGYYLVDQKGEAARRGGIIAIATSADAPAAPIAVAPGPAPVAAVSTATPAAAQPAAAPSPAWPKDFQVKVNFNIGVTPVASNPPGGPGAFGGPPGFGGPGAFRGGRGMMGKRPYVAIWIEDSNSKVIRVLGVLGNNPRYMADLTTFRTVVRALDQTKIRSVTRASRPNGLYSVVWDGLDMNGKAMPKGTYSVVIEINREHGRHAMANAVVVCDDQPHSVDIAATVESSASKVEYGPKPAPVVSATP